MAKFTPALALLFGLSSLAAAQETAKPLGKWERKIDKKHVTLIVEEHRLHVTIVDEKPHTVHADYHVTKDGIVYGVVTSVECDDDDSAEDDARAVLDAPFSCRFRIDEGALIIRDLKFQDMGTKDDPWNGRFKAVASMGMGTAKPTSTDSLPSYLQSDPKPARDSIPAFVPETAQFFLPSPKTDISPVFNYFMGSLGR